MAVIDDLFECQDCGSKWAEEELITPIPDLEQRISEGEPVPAGECPECGALCHRVERKRAQHLG